MLTLALVFCAAWLTMRLARGTPIADLLRRVTIDAPVRLLGRITRGHVLTAVALLVVGGLVMWQLEGDGVRLLSMMAPEIATWLTMFEVSAYLDAFVAAFALSSIVRLRGWRPWVAAFATRQVPGRRRWAYRSRPVRHRADNDDEADGRRSAPALLAA